jgi:REP element-mobilizing transposase RayT
MHEKKRATHASPLHAGPKPRSIGAIVGAFKSAATKRINELRDNAGCSVWQRNYYEHVIRNEEDLANIRRYIAENPLKWDLDENNPVNVKR